METLLPSRRGMRGFTQIPELTKVLRENVTITVGGQPEKVTVQQALLLRLTGQHEVPCKHLVGP
jgi:hypothetical protein